MKKFLFAAIVLLAFGSAAFAQEPLEPVAKQPQPELTAAEEAEARELAGRFWSRLTETNSAGPLIGELGTHDLVANFKRQLMGNLPDAADLEKNEKNPDQEQADLTNQVFLALDDETWKRFYGDFVDLHYLMLAGSRPDDSADSEDERTDGISAQAQAVLSSNPHLAALFGDDDDDQGFRSADEVRDVLATLEAAENIMRADLSGMPWPQIDVGEADDSDSANSNTAWKIHLCDLDPARYGRPKETRMIDVELPIGLIVTMIREEGKLRIVSIETQDD